MPWGGGQRRRCGRLQRIMDDRNLDLVVVGSPKNIFYFTGYITGRLFMPSILLVFKEDEPALITGAADSELAARNFGGEVLEYVDYSLDTRMRPYPSLAVETSRKVLTRFKPKHGRIGYEGWGLNSATLHELMRTYQDVELEDLSDDILLMRVSKDDDELEELRKAARLNDRAYELAKTVSVEGKTEVDIYAYVQSELIKEVGGYQYFYGDIVSGERCVNIGGPPTRKVLRNGETVILDLWVVTGEYWSDTCRTFVVGGKFSHEQEKVFKVLMEVLKVGEEILRPGVTGAEVYKAIYEAIDREGYGRYFPHHAGHCLGLEAWEPPYFIPGDNTPLRENAVCTLEPGIYFSEIGGVRLENNYIVRRDGVEVLNRFPLQP
jgi:Xaa-Pro aminopeptidase